MKMFGRLCFAAMEASGPISLVFSRRAHGSNSLDVLSGLFDVVCRVGLTAGDGNDGHSLSSSDEGHQEVPQYSVRLLLHNSGACMSKTPEKVIGISQRSSQRTSWPLLNSRQSALLSVWPNRTRGVMNVLVLAQAGYLKRQNSNHRRS